MLQFPVHWWRPRRVAFLFLKVFFFPQIVYFGFVFATCLFLTFLNPTATSLMATRTLQGTKVTPPRYLEFKAIPQVLKNALIYLEDHSFYTHHGILLGAIREAYETNQKVGRPAVGGSTITQQIARTLFLNPEKTYLRKYLEAGTALIMETLLGKHRIFDLYINLIEWGPGIFGAQAASFHYYNYDLRGIGPDGLYRMAAIITNPIKYNVWTLERNFQMRSRYNSLLNW